MAEFPAGSKENGHKIFQNPEGELRTSEKAKTFLTKSYKPFKTISKEREFM